MDYKTAKQVLLDTHVPDFSKLVMPDGIKGSAQERIESAMNEYSRQREQQEAISFAKFCVKHCNATAGDNFAFAEKPFAQLKIMTGEQLYNSQEFKSWQEKENRK